MNIYEFGALVRDGNEALVKYLQDAGLLKKELWCTDCSRQYTMVKCTGTVVGYTLRCPGCRKKRQLQTGTFLEGMHLPIAKFFGLMYFWAHETSVKHAVEFTTVSPNTAVQWYQYFQDICSWKMLATPIALGGPGKIVQIDETVMVRAKYHRGHQLRARQRWVFGVFDPEKKEGHIELVKNR